MKISEHVSFLLSCCSQSTDEATLKDSIARISDWEQLAYQASQLRIAQLVYTNLLKHGLESSVPEHVLSIIQKHYYKTIQKNTILYHTWTLFAAEFQKNNIPVVPLKGILLAESVYGDISRRQLSDIDVLIHRSHIPQCVEILTNMGFNFDERYKKSDFIQNLRDSKHIPLLEKQGIGIELHTSLMIEDKAFCVPIDDFWNNTIPANLSGIDCLQFTPEYLLIHICMHVDEHFVSAKIHFIGYVDILHIITMYADTIQWDDLLARCQNYGCEQHVFSHIYLSAKYLGAYIPTHIFLKAEQLCSDYKEEYFLHHIQCDSTYTPKKKNRNIAEIQHVHGLKAKCMYLLHDIFPSKTFMIHRYHLTNTRCYQIYYVKRIFDGIVSLVKYVLGIGKI